MQVSSVLIAPPAFLSVPPTSHGPGSSRMHCFFPLGTLRETDSPCLHGRSCGGHRSTRMVLNTRRPNLVHSRGTYAERVATLRGELASATDQGRPRSAELRKQSSEALRSERALRTGRDDASQRSRRSAASQKRDDDASQRSRREDASQRSHRSRRDSLTQRYATAERAALSAAPAIFGALSKCCH